jgi:hypothetical protein
LSVSWQRRSTAQVPPTPVEMSTRPQATNEPWRAEPL